jgi:hypothetical protein
MEVITGTTEHLIFIRTGSSYVKRWQRNKKKFEKNTNRTYRIFTPEKHLNVHNSLIKKHIAMRILHRWIPFVDALLLCRKNFTLLFPFWRNSQKNKKTHIFGAHTNK